ncbi:hypothetical protein MPSEU_000209400 [Mayamaea pseudoterrestris]|nr:hypothetical protein MPSEU_000209400 [Mayamaea pseudoterrestris]
MALQSTLSTRITKLLKCDYPIILPGMSWISTPPLVTAVSNAGGCGILATGPLNAEQTRESIRQIRQSTDKPFGIGATLLMPGAKENARVALEEQVPLINVSLGKADWIAQAAHEYGGIVLATVTNAKHAEAAIQAGADALMVTGHEAAAHGGDVTSLVLTPIVAAGGFANGRGLAAALVLGADAIAMGSRLAVSLESPLPMNVKEYIRQSSEADTIYGSNFDGIPARVLKTAASQQLMKKRPNMPTIFYRALQAAQSMGMPLWKVLPGLLTQFDKMFVVSQFGAATKSIMAATVDGDLEEGVQFVGQSQGMIKDIASVEDIMQRIVADARSITLEKAQKIA